MSIIVANLVMEGIEERALHHLPLPSGSGNDMWMHDACTSLPSHWLQDLLDHMNEVEASIKFTVKVESESRLPFLDVQLHHGADGAISTTVYRKPTHTDRYLNFSSKHPPGTQVGHCRNITPPSAVCDLVSGRPETGERSPTEGPSEEWLSCTGHPTSLRVTISPG